MRAALSWSIAKETVGTITTDKPFFSYPSAWVTKLFPPPVGIEINDVNPFGVLSAPYTHNFCSNDLKFLKPVVSSINVFVLRLNFECVTGTSVLDVINESDTNCLCIINSGISNTA